MAAWGTEIHGEPSIQQIGRMRDTLRKYDGRNLFPYYGKTSVDEMSEDEVRKAFVDLQNVLSDLRHDG